jgi:hypothetical protein
MSTERGSRRVVGSGRFGRFLLDWTGRLVLDCPVHEQTDRRQENTGPRIVRGTTGR